MGDKLQGQYINSDNKGGEVTVSKDEANDKTGLDVNLIGGSAAAGGQSGPAKVLKVEINNSTAVNVTQALIDDGLTTFNAINIQNRTGEEIEFNYISSWTYGDGWVIDNDTDSFRDVTNGAAIYVKSSTGTVDIKVEGIGNT